MSISPPRRSGLLRPGIDPLVDPRDIADLAASLMSPRDRMLLFLVDHSLVGHLCVAVECASTRSELADTLAAIVEATRGSSLTGLVIAERTESALDIEPLLVSTFLEVVELGRRVDAWVRFEPSSVHDVWPLVGPEVSS